LLLEQAHERRRDNAIIALQEQVMKLMMELKQIKGSEHQALHHQKFDINPNDIAYSSSHEDHEDRGIR